jgi:cell division septation protein DedD
MNTPGLKISSRLARIGLGFLALVIVGVIVWPHLWSAKASIPEVPVTHFAAPPSPIATPSFRKLLPLPIAQPSASPKAQPTPCQPCIEAANEVLTRYLHAIRTGAGADNREEKPNVYEAPQMVPNAPHPVYVPTVPGNDQPHF